MAKLSEMYPSRFLGKDDVTHPITATIKRIGQEEIKGDGGNQMKNVLFFVGDRPKPMILNKGNATMLAHVFGDDSDHWLGKAVEIYHDPTVMFGGKMVGGIRIRPVQQTPWPWQQALSEASRAGISEDALKAKLKEAGLTAYNAARDTQMVKNLIDEALGVPAGAPEGDSGGEIPF